MLTDPIADMLTRIRNANSVEKNHVDVPISREKAAQRITEEHNRRVEEAGSKKLEQTIQNMRLAVYQPTGDLYAKFINTKTGEVLKTVPPEALLKTWARMEEFVGKLVDSLA